MDTQQLKEKIISLIKLVMEEEAIELVDIKFSPVGKRWLLRLYIDKAEGITLDDCADISEKIGDMLDTEDVIHHPYVLEISSPGLDRQITHKEQFRRQQGKWLKVVLHQPINQETVYHGKLIGLDDEQIYLEKDDDNKITIRYDRISYARAQIKL